MAEVPAWMRQNMKKTAPTESAPSSVHTKLKSGSNTLHSKIAAPTYGMGGVVQPKAVAKPRAKPIQKFEDGGPVYDRTDSGLFGGEIKYRQDEEGRKYVPTQGIYGQNGENRYYSLDDVTSGLKKLFGRGDSTSTHEPKATENAGDNTSEWNAGRKPMMGGSEPKAFPSTSNGGRETDPDGAQARANMGEPAQSAMNPGGYKTQPDALQTNVPNSAPKPEKTRQQKAGEAVVKAAAKQSARSYDNVVRASDLGSQDFKAPASTPSKYSGVVKSRDLGSQDFSSSTDAQPSTAASRTSSRRERTQGEDAYDNAKSGIGPKNTFLTEERLQQSREAMKGGWSNPFSGIQKAIDEGNRIADEDRRQRAKRKQGD